MFESLPATYAKPPKGRAAALAAAFAVHSVLLSGLGVSSLFAVEAVPPPQASGPYVFTVVLPPPPAEPLGDRRSRPAREPKVATDPVTAAEPAQPKPLMQPETVATEQLDPIDPGPGELEPPGQSTGVVGSPSGDPNGVLGGAPGGTPGVPQSPDPPAEPEARILRVGGAVIPPQIMHRELPEYTAVMRHSRLQGEVVVEAVIDELGRVTDLRVMSSPHPLLSAAATKAMHNWRFDPGRLNGHAVPVYFQLRVRFNLR